MAALASLLSLLAALIFGLVLLNIHVAQNSFRLEALQQQVSEQQDMYRQMRYRVASAQSPARLAETAEKMGLVAPVQQEYLPGPPPPGTYAKSADEDIPAGDQNLKALLAGRR